MATPISALARTGASLMPSPTKARRSLPTFLERRRSTWATLSCGRSWACTSSTPRAAAACAAARRLSPVSMTTRFTPAARSPSTALRAVGLITSEIRRYPAYTPFTATCTTVPASSGSGKATPRRVISFAFPAATSSPATRARTPWPESSSTWETRLRSGVRGQAAAMLRPMGWLEKLSTRAAFSKIASASMSPAGRMAVTWNLPRVRVPVLSKTTCFVFARSSR